MEREVRVWRRRIWWISRLEVWFLTFSFAAIMVIVVWMTTNRSGVLTLLAFSILIRVLYGYWTTGKGNDRIQKLRKTAAPVLAPTTDMETLRWLYPEHEPAPPEFWERVLAFPPRNGKWDLREEFARRIRLALEAQSAPEELLFRVVRWQESAQRAPVGHSRAIFFGMRDAFSEPFRARFDSELVWRSREI